MGAIFEHAEKALEDENLEEMQIAATMMKSIIDKFSNMKDAYSTQCVLVAKRGLGKLITKIAILA